MSVPNFSSLACLEVAEKFVVAGLGGVGWMWNTWQLCLTPTLVALELLWVALSYCWGLSIMWNEILLYLVFTICKSISFLVWSLKVKSNVLGNLIPCKHIIFCMIPESAQVLHKSPNCFTPFPINLFPLGLKAVRFAMHLPTPCNTAKHRWQYMQTGTLTEIFTLWPQGLNGQPWYK